MHNSSNVVEIRFNDDKSYSCRKTRWPSEPEGSTDKPHARLLDNDNTCQLTIPNAAKTDFVDYRCRVKLQLSSETIQYNCISQEIFQRNCYLLSETIIPSEALLSDMDVMHNSDNNTSTIAIAVAVPVVTVLTVTLIVASVVVVKKRKPCRRHTARPGVRQNDVQLQIQNQQGGYIPPIPPPSQGN